MNNDFEEKRNMCISEIVAKTIVEITKGEDDSGDVLTFVTDDGDIYDMFHEQSCCEYITLEDIVGDLEDLKNTPIVIAREDTNRTDEPAARYVEDWKTDSYTWTFYKMATFKGYVTFRWFGSSNGCYSEKVSFIKRKNKLEKPWYID